MIIDAGGVELEVLEWGDSAGHPLLFWHGLGPFNAGAMMLNVAGPEWAAAGFRVVAPNAPGFGSSPALPSAEYRTGRLAEIATAVLEVLELDRVSWVGFSWGGRIGLRVPPDRLDALVLLDVGYLEFHEQPDYQAKTCDERVADIRTEVESYRFASWDELFATARQHFRWTRGIEERLRTAMCERNGEIVPRLAPEVLAAALGAIAEETQLDRDSFQALANAGLPVLLLVATKPEESEGARAAGLRRFADGVPQAEIRRIEDAGHNVLNDAPEQTIAAVAEFLSRLR